MDKIGAYLENTIENITHLLETLIDAFSHLLTHVMDRIDKSVENLGDKVYNALTSILDSLEKAINAIMDHVYCYHLMLLYGFFRWTTIPLNWLIIRTWLWWIFKPFDKKPYLKPGLHYWTAPPRGGKSLASFCIAEEIREEQGFAAYLTSPIEKPRLSEDKKYWYVYHPVIDLNNYYKDGKKVLNFSTDKYPIMFKDENHVEQNPRLNKTKTYNNRFIPEHNDELLMAHEGFLFGVHILSQQKKTDSQRMETITVYHEIEKTVKGINYGKWIKDGKFEIIPKYIKVRAYTLKFLWNQNAKQKLLRRYKIKVPYEILPYYETLAESKRFAHLPYDKK